MEFIKAIAKPDWSGEQFEYIQINNLETRGRIDMLNRYGKLGWELVAVRGGNNYIFKRKIYEGR